MHKMQNCDEVTTVKYYRGKMSLTSNSNSKVGPHAFLTEGTGECFRQSWCFCFLPFLDLQTVPSRIAEGLMLRPLRKRLFSDLRFLLLILVCLWWHVAPDKVPGRIPSTSTACSFSEWLSLLQLCAGSKRQRLNTMLILAWRLHTSIHLLLYLLVYWRKRKNVAVEKLPGSFFFFPPNIAKADSFTSGFLHMHHPWLIGIWWDKCCRVRWSVHGNTYTCSAEKKTYLFDMRFPPVWAYIHHSLFSDFHKERERRRGSWRTWVKITSKDTNFSVPHCCWISYDL